MTRPKVDPDKRQRTAQACDSCKKRKQKCNGHLPCSMCCKRRLECIYTPPHQHHDKSPTSLSASATYRVQDGLFEAVTAPPNATQVSISSSQDLVFPWVSHAPDIVTIPVPPVTMHMDELRPSKRHCAMYDKLYEVCDDEIDADTDSRDSHSSSGINASALLQSRMIETSEGQGRVIHVGDTATLAYLQIVRSLFSIFLGDNSEFTDDSARHTILEMKAPEISSTRQSSVLPDRPTTEALVESFFVHTIGFTDLFDRDRFLEQVGCCFSNPFAVASEFMSQLYLVLAIGLILANKDDRTHGGQLIAKLHAQSLSYAESFFTTARSRADVRPDFESADIATIETLLLIALWKLVSWRRDSAHHYLGIAVHSAYALGLHQEENDEVFRLPNEKRQRRRLWRSLMTFDSFLGAAGLGRPLAISHEDYLTFKPGSSVPQQCTECSAPTSFEHIRILASQATTKTSYILSTVLRKLYVRHKISASGAAGMAGLFEAWNRSLPDCLHWRHLQDENLDRAHGVAMLHVNVFQLNVVILLTRPFYLFHMKAALPETCEAEAKQLHVPRLLRDLSQSCMEASYHLLYLTNLAKERNILARCSPFAIHPTFTAALITLTNDFAPLYRAPNSELSVRHMHSVLEFCAVEDHQARRYLDIVGRFDRSIGLKMSQREGPLLKPTVARTIRTVSADKGCDPMFTLSHDAQPKPAASTRPLAPRASSPTAIHGVTGANVTTAASLPSPEGNMSTHSGGSVSTAILDANGMLMDAGPSNEISFYYNELYQPKSQERVASNTFPTTDFGVAPYGQAPWSNERVSCEDLPQQ